MSHQTMLLKSSHLISILVLFCGINSLAATFVVISNADSGPGSLREAITLANANGTATRDSIIFNIPDVSEAGRTIILQTELPVLSSNIAIDGSTQPGTVLGISTAKITLFLDHYTAIPFTFLFIQNASDVSIYGLCFKFFENPDAGGGLNYAIGLRNSSHIKIGAPGKGNLFSAVRQGITNNYWDYYTDSVSYVVIQSNVFGLDNANVPVRRGTIDLIRASDIEVGGIVSDEGNVLVGAHILLSQTGKVNSGFFAKVQNNKLNLNWDGTRYFSEGGSITLWGNITDDTSTTKSFILDNVISSGWPGGIALQQLGHKAVVKGNKIGMDITGTICTGSYNDIGIYSCKNVVIGGYTSAEENIIAQNIYVTPHGTHIIKNQIGGRIDNNGTPPNDPFIKILTYDNGLITGIANPNSKIQVYADQCYQSCPAKKYFATTFSDGQGNWSFAYTAVTPPLVATATMNDSSTSAFTEPIVDHVSQRIITDATCGRSNGSITGIIVTEGTHIKWFDSYTAQLIGTDTNLRNVPAGSYYMTVSNGENGCPWSVNLVINDQQPPPTLSQLNITEATCGQNNGVILTYDFNYGSKWLNQNGDSIGTGYFINNLFPGTYYLKLWVNYDTSCNKTYGPFEIINQSGASLNLDDIQITNATCDNTNGSIKNITAINTTGSSFIQWLDSLNNPVGNSFDLLNQPAGIYRLKFIDQGGCDTITTPWYRIQAAGKINIDLSAEKVISAGCTVNNGAISYISIIGADTYRWENVADHAFMGSSIDLKNLPAGNYQLTASNSFGCSASSPVITVPPGSFSDILPAKVEVKNAFCDENNGMVSLQNFTTDPSYYSFSWIDSASGQVISHDENMIDNLGEGRYVLTAVDTNGCEKKIFSTTVHAYAKPVIDLSTMTITPDQCSLSEGKISGIQVKGAQGSSTYSWTDENNLVVGSSSNLRDAGKGKYRLTVENNGCVVQSDWLFIDNNDQDNVLPVYDDVTIPRNSSATFNIKNHEAGTYILYADAAGSQVLQQNATGIFVTNALNNDEYFYVRHVKGSCSSALVPIKVVVVDQSMFAIPSAFTPNNDGTNDLLRLKVIGYIDVEYFKIYNRNGEQVFSTKTINNGWDGKFRGNEQPTAVFVWIAKGKDITGKTITAKGTFVLIR